MEAKTSRQPIREVIERSRTTLFLPGASAILLILTLPAINLWPLIWVALVPLIYFLTSPTLLISKKMIGVFCTMLPYGFFVILPLFSVSGAWFESGANIFQVGVIERIIFLPMVALLSGAIGASFCVPFILLISRLTTTPTKIALAGIVWLVAEWLRSNILLFGFSWGVFGYALIDMPYISYAARLPGGVLALSFLIIVVNLSLVELIRVYNEPKPRSLMSMRTLQALGLSIVLLFALPFLGITLTKNTECASSPLRVAVIPSQFTTAESMHAEIYPHIFGQILAALEGGARLAVLPENIFPLIELSEETWQPIAGSYSEVLGPYEELLRISRAYPDGTLAVGLHTQKNEAHYNSVILLAGGEVRGVYHKQHLVPFGEYTPRLFTHLVPGYEKLTPGDAKRGDRISLREIPLHMLVCSEAGVLINERVPGIILSPSNDSVFSSKNVGVIHHLFSRMRALEQNAYLLRSSKGGISSIIAPDGKVITQSVGSDEVLFANVEPRCPI